MRARWLLAAAAAMAAGVPAAAATRDYPVGGFDRVRLEAVADVSVRAGPRATVHAEGDPALVAALHAEVRGDTLVLFFPRGTHTGSGARLAVAVTTPRLAGLALVGVGQLVADRAEGPQVAIEKSGVGTVSVAAVRAGTTTVTSTGTGEVKLAGSTDRLEVHASGVGSVDAAGLAARSAAIESSGVGSVHARVDGPATVSASGIGSVTVDGQARCTVHKSGIGSVRCGA